MSDLSVDPDLINCLPLLNRFSQFDSSLVHVKDMYCTRPGPTRFISKRSQITEGLAFTCDDLVATDVP